MCMKKKIHTCNMIAIWSSSTRYEAVAQGIYGRSIGDFQVDNGDFLILKASLIKSQGDIGIELEVSN
jgi:hypothetical protein